MASLARRAAKVRAALTTRNRALVELPEYARWIPHRHPEDQLKDDLSGTLVELWNQVHTLSGMVETPLEAGDADLGPLDQAHKSVGTGLEQIARKFADQGSKFSSDRLREDFQAAAAAAAVAFPDSPELTLRSTIWDRLDTIGAHDLEVALKGAKAELSPDLRTQAGELLRRRSRMQGLMATAALGRDWFDDAAFKDRGSFEQTLQRVLAATEEDEQSPKAWWREIAAAGERIGLRWQRLASEIDSLAGEANSLADNRVVQDKLRSADRLARLLDGGAPAVPESKAEATSLLRLSRVHDLLLWMAERTWKDHWYDVDPKAIKPYYQAAGQRFASDAEKLVAKSAELPRVQKLLAEKDRLKLDGPTRSVLTSELSKDLPYRVSAEGDPPPGLPVIKPEPDSRLQLEGGNAGYRLTPWRTGGDKLSFTVFDPAIRGAERDPKLSRPRMTRSRFTVKGMFRGQHFDGVTDVELHPSPDVVAIGPQAPDPPAASLAVRASEEIIQRYGEGTGSIAIVLDCSGSMITRGERNSRMPRLPSSRSWRRSYPGGRRLACGPSARSPMGSQSSLRTTPSFRSPSGPSSNGDHRRGGIPIRSISSPGN